MINLTLKENTPQHVLIAKGHKAHCARFQKPSGHRGIIPRYLRASDEMWTTWPMAKRITAKIHAHLIHVFHN